MPDLNVLIDIADYYNVQVGEILCAKREEHSMNGKVENTIVKIADYSNLEKKKLARRMCIIFVLGLIAFSLYLILTCLGLDDNSEAWQAAASSSLGFAFGVMLTGVLYTSGCLAKFKSVKNRLLKKE